MEKKFDVQYKVVLLGESTVGKTSLFKRFIHNEYKEIDIKNRTVKACCGEKIVSIDKKNVLLNVWDTAGEEKYHALAPNYYRDANGALLIFDITKIESFNLIEKWIQEIKSVVASDSFQIIICANKYDLISYSQVTEDDIKKLAENYEADYVCVSAKENTNVHDSFSLLAGKILSSNLMRTQSIRKKKTIKVDKRSMSMNSDNRVVKTKSDSSCC